MKRYYIYILSIVANLFVGCAVDYSIPVPDVVDEGEIEVTFRVDGQEVRVLDLASVSHTIVVDVEVNEDDIYWQPVSSQDWCTILEEDHRGSGSFTVVINANNSFDAREDAIITFVAGQYSKSMLRVAHDGNIFVLDEVYAASTKSGNSRTVKVKTPRNVVWDVKADEWITVSKGESVTADGITTTTLNISWAENTGTTRYGAVSLSKSGEAASGWYTIWQYGTDVNYDQDGFVLLESKNVQPFELRVPVQTVKEITLPSWITYEVVHHEDRTVSYMLQCEDNPSDARYIRSAQPVLSMLSGAADIVLPTIKQNYYDIKGLVSARGLVLLSKTWNEGGDISQWMIDDDIAMVADIDFMDIPEHEWKSIGIQERPLSVGFNGNGKKIYNLNAGEPLFGHCNGITIKNLYVDSSSSFEVTDSDNDEFNIASLANSIVATTIDNCKNNANITLSAADDAHSASFVGGLVCKMDGESYIKNSSNLGNIIVQQVNSKLTLGGLVGEVAQAQVETSSNVGRIAFESEVYIPRQDLYVGGIAGNISNVEGKLINCTNSGPIYTAGNNIGATIYTGGLAGFCAGVIKDSSNSAKGAITTALVANTHYVGGITGAVGADEGCLIVDNSNGANINYNSASTRGTDDEGKIFAIGGVVGYTSGGAADITGNSNNASVTTSSSARFVYIGGVLGWMGNVITGNIKNNSVGSNAIINATGKGRTTAIGGLVGMMSNGSTLDLEGDTGEVKCTVKGGNSENSSYTVGVGGIVGSANGAAIIKNSHTWQGTLYLDSSVTNSNPVGFGGIIGYASNNLTIENCTTYGSVQSNLKTALKGSMAIGGMVGIFNKESGVCTISGCTNHSDLSLSATATKSNYKPVNMAGIIGAAVQGDVTITDCHNKHGFYNQNQNGCVTQIAKLETVLKGSYAAGIIGSYGVSMMDMRQTTNGTLTINNCTNNSTESQNHADYKDMIRNHRGCSAGIAGFVRDATISNCINYGPIVRTNAGVASGIVAVALKSTISNCIATCTATGGTGAGFYAHAAGIVAILLEESTIDGCSFYGTIKTASNGTDLVTYCGAISGYTGDDCVISNCKLGGIVNGVAVTKDNLLQIMSHWADFPELAVKTNYTVEDYSYWDGN